MSSSFVGFAYQHTWPGGDGTEILWGAHQGSQSQHAASGLQWVSDWDAGGVGQHWGTGRCKDRFCVSLLWLSQLQWEKRLNDPQYGVLLIYRSRVSHGIGYIAVADMAPKSAMFLWNCCNSKDPIISRPFFTKSSPAYLYHEIMSVRAAGTHAVQWSATSGCRHCVTE